MKVGAIIFSRMSSRRLPSKALIEINGRTLLGRVIDLTKLIEGVEILYKQRWAEKIPVKEEKDTANFAFASVVSIKKIKKGDIFSKDNLWVKRPGTGEILAENLSKLYGKISQREINKDEFIKLKDYK